MNCLWQQLKQNDWKRQLSVGHWKQRIIPKYISLRGGIKVKLKKPARVMRQNVVIYVNWVLTHVSRTYVWNFYSNILLLYHIITQTQVFLRKYLAKFLLTLLLRWKLVIWKLIFAIMLQKYNSCFQFFRVWEIMQTGRKRWCCIFWQPARCVYSPGLETSSLLMYV